MTPDLIDLLKSSGGGLVVFTLLMLLQHLANGRDSLRKAERALRAELRGMVAALRKEIDTLKEEIEECHKESEDRRDQLFLIKEQMLKLREVPGLSPTTPHVLPDPPPKLDE